MVTGPATGLLLMALRPGLPPMSSSASWPRFTEITRAPDMPLTLADHAEGVEPYRRAAAWCAQIGLSARCIGRGGAILGARPACRNQGDSDECRRFRRPAGPGPVRPGPVRPGPVRPGPVRPGPVR